MDTLFQILKIFLGPLVIISGLLITIRHFKIVRTISYIERFNNPNMAAIRGKVDNWLNSSKSNQEKIEIINSDSELRANVFSFLNIFNEVGIAYKFGLLNKKVAFEIWDTVVPEYWEKLKFFIDYNRNQGRAIGANFEKIAKDIIRTKKLSP